ncbi:hypothetical protein Mapa_010077 [Marchantia paleacea]|nr:hypothetical protein Mapa_010077 [Marchantia paleacea]
MEIIMLAAGVVKGTPSQGRLSCCSERGLDESGSGWRTIRPIPSEEEVGGERTGSEIRIMNGSFGRWSSADDERSSSNSLSFVRGSSVSRFGPDSFLVNHDCLLGSRSSSLSLVKSSSWTCVVEKSAAFDKERCLLRSDSTLDNPSGYGRSLFIVGIIIGRSACPPAPPASLGSFGGNMVRIIHVPPPPLPLPPSPSPSLCLPALCICDRCLPTSKSRPPSRTFNFTASLQLQMQFCLRHRRIPIHPVPARLVSFAKSVARTRRRYTRFTD